MKRDNERFIFHTLLSLPKSIYFCLRCFPLKTALKLPVLVSYKTKLKKLSKNRIRFTNDPYRFQVKIGIGGVNKLPSRVSMIFLTDGYIEFSGKAVFTEGIVLANEGVMKFGDNFYANRNSTIWAAKSISFGDNCLLGWNVLIRDSDGHQLYDADHNRLEMEKPIRIGNHCWLCAETKILKGAMLGDESILGMGSILTGKIDEDHVLAAGVPARIKKREVYW